MNKKHIVFRKVRDERFYSTLIKVEDPSSCVTDLEKFYGELGYYITSTIVKRVSHGETYKMIKVMFTAPPHSDKISFILKYYI